jgi:GTP:adenosylcobinamide-phosphate guanylyltransferase
MTQVDALIAAGGRSKPDDPLLPLTKGGPKALLPIAGKPMAQWVLDAVAASDRVGRAVVVGLGPEHGLTCGDKPVDYIPNAGNIVDNTRAGVRRIQQLNPGAKHALLVSADIPALRPDHIAWLVDTALQTDHDFYYTIIERRVMESRYPASRRSYTHLKGLTVCGGDMNLLATRVASDDNPLWNKIAAARKNVFRQVSLAGFSTLFLFAIRQLSVARAEQIASRRMGVRCRAILCPFAEIGMDVDKPFQYEIVAKDLEKRRDEAPSLF